MRILCAILCLMIPLALAGAERIKRREDDLASLSREKSRSAVLEKWVHPVYPQELKGENLRTHVWVRYIVDEHGAVTSPETLGGDERFSAAALATIQQWKYQPEIIDGKPGPVSLEVNFEFRPSGPPKGISHFSPPYTIQYSTLRQPEERQAPAPAYPKHLEARQLFGEVELNLGVNKEGRVEGVEVLRSTHADFLSAAFSAVEQWTFEPARRGRVPTEGEQRAVLSFTVMDTETDRAVHNEWLEKNGITLRHPGVPKAADYFTEIPQAETFADPVYPYEFLKDGVEGTARINFSVDQQGQVRDVSLVEASQPEFGYSLVAAVMAWKFRPMYHDGEKTQADFTVQWQFTKPTGENTAPENVFALTHTDGRVGAKQLDRPLTPLYVRPPVCAEAQSLDEAEIEVTINQSGRVCWPRIIKATTPAFGWAAATAVSQWYFETPRKEGRPVDVRVVIPVQQGRD